jgi:hypothetical protein
LLSLSSIRGKKEKRAASFNQTTITNETQSNDSLEAKKELHSNNRQPLDISYLPYNAFTRLNYRKSRKNGYPGEDR